MKEEKVLPKLRERIQAFRELVSISSHLSDSPKERETKKRFLMFGFPPLSPRIIRAINSLRNEEGVEVIAGQSLAMVAHTVADLCAFHKELRDNHFARSAQMLVGEMEISKLPEKEHIPHGNNRSDDSRLPAELKEMLDKMMQRGYVPFMKKNYEEACGIWLRLWDKFRDIIAKHDIHGSSGLGDGPDAIYSGLQYFYNWSQDLADALENSAVQNPEWWPRAKTYAEEFRSLLSESDDLLLVNMAILEATALGSMDNRSGELAVLDELPRLYPKCSWSWIALGDYWSGMLTTGKMHPLDLDKARSIYEEGLKRSEDDLEAIMERLYDLERNP